MVPIEIQSISMQSGCNGDRNFLLSIPSLSPVTIFLVILKSNQFNCTASVTPLRMLRMIDSLDNIHVSLVMSKTSVSPIKRTSIPRLELCGAHVLARLLTHVKEILQIPMSQVFAWTDSFIVLNWLSGNPRRFKTYVGNQVSSQIPRNRWNHVIGVENPAGCASRGILPSKLLEHKLWWDSPPWLRMDTGLIKTFHLRP